MPMTDREHAAFALKAARRLAYHTCEQAGTFEELAAATGEEADMKCANHWMGAQALAEELLEHLDGLESIVRAAADRCPACGEVPR